MNKNIILYSNGCPKCRVLETKLETKNISYIKNKNVSEIADMGFQSLPVLKVDNSYLGFAEANNWINNQPEQTKQSPTIKTNVHDKLTTVCNVN